MAVNVIVTINLSSVTIRKKGFTSIEKYCIEGGGCGFLSIRVQSCRLFMGNNLSHNSMPKSSLCLPRSHLGSRPLVRSFPMPDARFLRQVLNLWGRARNKYAIWMLVQCV